MLFDIDHFKKINDTHGHLAGDYVLPSSAHAGERRCAHEDVFARYGGEEFAVICRGTEVGRAGCGRAPARGRRGPQVLYEGTHIPVTISVGVARAPRAGVTSPAEFVAVADETMYEAKRTGRNKVCVAS